MPLASFHYAVASRDELLRDVVELVVADEGVAAATFLETASTPREAIKLALTGYLDHVKADPGNEQAMFELTQYALRNPHLADLPAEQRSSGSAEDRARGALAVGIDGAADERSTRRADDQPGGAVRPLAAQATF